MKPIVVAFWIVTLITIPLESWAWWLAWGWLAIPCGAPALGMAQIYGLLFLVRGLSWHQAGVVETRAVEEEIAKDGGAKFYARAIGASVSRPPILIVGAWLIHWIATA